MSQEKALTQKSDRYLIAGALLILLLALGFLYFDNWSSYSRGGDVIGKISEKSGDVRMRFEGDVRWQSASQGQDLVYNDAIFAGDGSQAKLKLGKSGLTVSSNTLVVLRKEQNANLLNLSYGSIFGRIAKNETVLIDTGDGKRAVLKTTSDTNIILKKSKTGKTELQVTKGVAMVKENGRVHKVDRSRPLVLTPDKVAAAKPAPPPPPRPLDLRALQPRIGDVIYSAQPAAINFKWRYGDEFADRANAHFVLEFSKSPTFDTIYTQKNVTGSQTVLHASQSVSLYYRVRGPKGEMSETEQVSFVRMSPPQIIAPAPDARYRIPAGSVRPMPIAFSNVPGHPSYWYQIATDKDFNKVAINKATTAPSFRQNISAGKYFIRARSDYGQNHLSDWSPPTEFVVKEKRIQAAPRWAFDNKVLIPAANYPVSLYKASPQTVSKYLASHGFLDKYFAVPKDQADGVIVDFMDGKGPHPLKNFAWPEDKVRPERFSYRYQVVKQGALPSPWSKPETLHIALQPPQELSSAPIKSLKLRHGKAPMEMSFTPLLFASNYEVQVAKNPSFENAKSVTTRTPHFRMAMKPGSTYYWRARALDANKRPLSDYSAPAQVDLSPSSPAMQLVLQDAARNRKPAAEETATSTMSASWSSVVRPFEKSGFWAWLGSGTNYVDYQQSIPGRGTVNFHNFKGPSQYLEVGYLGSRHFGFVVSYKSTPGNINVSNAAVDSTSYNWRTLSLEGLFAEPTGRTIWGRPVSYGILAGVQQHMAPFLFLDSSDDLELKTNDMLTASLGGLVEVGSGHWRYHLKMRYQFPLSSRADGASEFSLAPKFAFDGLVGASYYITERFKAGLFWYGQWHQYNFVYSDGAISNSGFQSLFYSNVDLRLGFDF